jgi:Flp pilus assembly protein TadG
MVAVSAIAILALAPVVFDLGRVVIGAQLAQDAADAAALAAMTQFPSASYSAANQRISDTVSANSATTRLPVTCNSSETVYYAGGATPPGWSTLGPYDEGVTVTTHVAVNFYFAGAVGLTGTTVTRKSTVVTSQAAGAPMTPMWVAEDTPYAYGVSYQLHMATSPAYPGIPGNFGWLTPLTGEPDFVTLLEGYEVDPATLAANYTTVGDTVWGLTGQKVRQWKAALSDSGNGRLARATWAPWTNDTFTDYHNDNPRLMIIPICQYVGGSGANAQFTIVEFGVWWLESVDSNGKDIYGRFIEYTIPGAAGSPADAFTGLWTTRLVH